MLNISPYSVKAYVKPEEYSALARVESFRSKRTMMFIMAILILIFVVFLFLPWAQNIRSNGNVMALKPDQRPQTVHSVIGGQITRWHVQDGDYVEKGDTILQIKEVKDAYFDPALVDRTSQQLESKSAAASSYMGKARAIDDRIKSLREVGSLKLQQAKYKLRQAQLKTTSDSIELEAAQTRFDIAQNQFKRMEELYDKGLRSKTDFEERRLNLQNKQADLISKENALLTSQNDVLNAQVELNAINAQLQKDVADAASDRFTALSNMYDAEVAVSKLENDYTNYSIRNELYYITAPQNGYVTQVLQSGIGEVIKEGTPIVSIMPEHYDLAVQMYVKPIDVPLLEKGQPVRIQFDGWPAIVFSGWPETSYGTYGGLILSIDQFISPNGYFRVVVVPDPEDKAWPEPLRVGGGTRAMILLGDVPIWYEMWRRINGFPPNYYAAKTIETK